MEVYSRAGRGATTGRRRPLELVDARTPRSKGRVRAKIINLTDRRAAARARPGRALFDVGPTVMPRELARSHASVDVVPVAEPLAAAFVMRRSRRARGDVHSAAACHARAAADREPEDFPDLLLQARSRQRTVRAPRWWPKVVHGEPCRFSDPARSRSPTAARTRHRSGDVKCKTRTIGVSKPRCATQSRATRTSSRAARRR